MSLIVEDGTGKADAESYASVADADAYLAKRGNTTWADLDQGVKEAALVKASDYLTATYTLRWSGVRKTTTQALDWPRQIAERPNVVAGYGNGVLYYDDDIVPIEVRNACIELASRAASADLLADEDPNQVASESVSGAVSVTYRDSPERQTRYAFVERMLSTVLVSFGSIPMVRA